MKTVIVTGASRGIGAATVRALRADGVRVVGIARSASPLHSLSLEKIGTAPFEYVVGHVCDLQAIKSAISLAISGERSLDGLVLNAAAIEPLSRVADMDMSRLRQHIEVNLIAQLMFLKEALPELRRSKGTILFVSSGVVEHPMDAWSPYVASKAAMNGVIGCLAREEPDITCISIRPGVVDTQMVEQALRDGKGVMNKASLEELQSRTGPGDLLEPQVPGTAIAKIVQEAPRHLSGQFLSFNDPLLRGLK